MNARIRFHYTLTLKGGTLIESTIGKEPLAFIAGRNEIITGLEHGMAGMKSGESRKIIVKAEDAYGNRDESAIHEVPKDQFSQEACFEVGMQLSAQNPQDNITLMTITEIRENTLMLDFNHPLANKDLYYDITIIDIELIAPPEPLNPFIDADLTEDFDFDRELDHLSASAKAQLHALQPGLQSISSILEDMMPEGVLGYMLVPVSADDFIKPTLHCLLDDALAGEINLDEVIQKLPVNPQDFEFNFITLSGLQQSLMRKQTELFDLFANGIIFRDYVALLAILRHACLYRNLLEETFKEHLVACFALGTWLESPDYYNVEMVVVVDTHPPEHTLISAKNICRNLADRLCEQTHVYQWQQCYSSTTFWDDIAKDPNDMSEQLRTGLPFYIR